MRRLEKDVMGTYDCGIYQPVFSVIVKEFESGTERDVYEDYPGGTRKNRG